MPTDAKPTLAYARWSYAREKHPLDDRLTQLRAEGFDALIQEVRAEAIREYADYLDSSMQLHAYAMDDEDWAYHRRMTASLRKWAEYVEAGKNPLRPTA